LGSKSFITGRIKAVGYAFKGALLLLRTEHSIQVQAFIAVCVTILGFVFNITTTEWMMQVFAIGLIMSVEGVNTAIEAIADFIHPEFHVKIGKIKDIAAGAVFITAVTATIIGLIIYVPYFIELYNDWNS
jgi:diacylglycerol kinase (ATP)